MVDLRVETSYKLWNFKGYQLVKQFSVNLVSQAVCIPPPRIKDMRYEKSALCVPGQ